MNGYTSATTHDEGGPVEVPNHAGGWMAGGFAIAIGGFAWMATCPVGEGGTVPVLVMVIGFAMCLAGFFCYAVHDRAHDPHREPVVAEFRGASDRSGAAPRCRKPVPQADFFSSRFARKPDDSIEPGKHRDERGLKRFDADRGFFFGLN